MELISPRFVLILLASFVSFQLSRPYRRWLVLLAAGAAFYVMLAGLAATVVLLAVVALDFLGGLAIEGAPSGRSQTSVLWCVVAANMLVLVASRWSRVDAGSVLTTSTALVGASFYVLQGTSYVADVYLGKLAAERRPALFALYMTFFPKVLMGPIERAGDLLPRLRSRLEFRYDAVRFGLFLIAVGLFKKLVLADHLAVRVDMVYDAVPAHRGLVFLLATYLYALQIYFDFSGYSDVAVGAARIFDIELTRNFAAPYSATTVAEFWRRWHISFSRWLLDYVFAPLQLNMRSWGTAGTVVALVTTFIISGLWHGASATFLVWGALHGMYLAAAVVWRGLRGPRSTLPSTRALARAANVLITFHLVCLGWVFFRARSVEDAWFILSHVFDGVVGSRALLLSEPVEFLVIATALALVGVARFVSLRRDPFEFLFSRPLWIRWIAYYAVVLSVLLLQVRAKSTFIYFRF